MTFCTLGREIESDLAISLPVFPASTIFFRAARVSSVMTARRRRLPPVVAAAAAALIGAQYRWGGWHDLAIFNDDPSRRQTTGLIRELRPEIVITSAPSDYLADHEMVSLLVRDACFAAGAPNYQVPSEAPALDWIPHLYFMDPIEGLDREGRPVAPDFVVDVASEFATKWAMLACHESQRNWLKAHHGMDNYLTMMEAWTRQRGASAGYELGEGFRQYRGHPYPRTAALQELLGFA